MKEYHKPKIELKLFAMKNVLDLSGETQFGSDWFTTTGEGNS